VARESSTSTDESAIRIDESDVNVEMSAEASNRMMRNDHPRTDKNAVISGKDDRRGRRFCATLDDCDNDTTLAAFIADGNDRARARHASKQSAASPRMHARSASRVKLCVAAINKRTASTLSGESGCRNVRDADAFWQEPFYSRRSDVNSDSEHY
jgi:hypothetical protein